LRDRHGGLCHRASLGAPAWRGSGIREAHTTGLREAYVRRRKNDAADAAAICEAVTRLWDALSCRIKSAEHRALLMRTGCRELLVGQRTALSMRCAGTGGVRRGGPQGARHVV